jgi:hypothetical protein
MRVLRHPVFLGAVALFGLNQGLEALGVYLPGVHAWLDDVLCLPVVLGLALACMRGLVYRDRGYCLSPFQIGFALVQISLVFEWWLPLRDDRYVGDPLDVLAYAAGAVIFAVFINHPDPFRNSLPSTMESL